SHLFFPFVIPICYSHLLFLFIILIIPIIPIYYLHLLLLLFPFIIPVLPIIPDYNSCWLFLLFPFIISIYYSCNSHLLFSLFPSFQFIIPGIPIIPIYLLFPLFPFTFPVCPSRRSSPVIRIKEEPPSPTRSPQVEEPKNSGNSGNSETPLSPSTFIDSILRENDSGAAPGNPQSQEKCLSVACLDKNELNEHLDTIDSSLDNLQAMLSTHGFTSSHSRSQIPEFQFLIPNSRVPISNPKFPHSRVPAPALIPLCVPIPDPKFPSSRSHSGSDPAVRSHSRSQIPEFPIPFWL
uniref:Vertebrate heat shock transcription factor C-terminal domain-containing protein n=1 Tax=Ficedula albicollis TaxID=59894 RepID=A0A803W1Z2_FICAL